MERTTWPARARRALSEDDLRARYFDYLMFLVCIHERHVVLFTSRARTSSYATRGAALRPRNQIPSRSRPRRRQPAARLSRNSKL